MMVLPWSRLTRLLTFLLASTSIGSLVAHFYGLATMQWSVCFIALPSFLVLVAMWVVAQWRSNYPVAEMFVTGVLSGFVAACIYDLFRLPFVLLHLSHSLSVWALPLFKVFPCFGALILGEPQLQDSYSPIAHLLGWAYHFSNGIGFGLMYVSAVGNPAKRSWLGAVAMALTLEAAMLLMPYPKLFALKVSTQFIVLTLAAHLVFGVVLGLLVRFMARRKASRPS